MSSNNSVYPVNKNDALDSYNKWKYTLYTTIVLLLLFNPFTFKFMNSLLSNFVGKIANNEGGPTLLGFTIHTVVFTLILRYMMDLKI
jgi:threonine/homoserine/homoserine lactone efflux protein